ncbi:hypothetical protein MTO96_051574 [Rhipicephalus appendiculatus]
MPTLRSQNGVDDVARMAHLPAAAQPRDPSSGPLMFKAVVSGHSWGINHDTAFSGERPLFASSARTPCKHAFRTPNITDATLRAIWN